MNDLLFAVKGTGGGDAPPPPPPPRRGGAAGAGGPYDLEEGGGLGTNPAAAGLPGTERARELEGFFAAAEDVKRDLADIRQRQRGIAALHERGKTIVRQKEMRQHQEQMQQAVNEVNVVASRAKAKIEALDRDNELALAKRGQGVGSASERTRTSVTTGLKRKLKDLMGEFGDLRAR
jgi:syntaxin 1B/2/3